MTTILELGIYAVINGFTTAIVLAINDRLFKRQVDKMFVRIESKLYKLRSANRMGGNNENKL